MYKKEEGKSFGLLHSWNILRHEQKWHETCATKKQKTSSNSSPRASTPPSYASDHGDQEESANHSTDGTNARPDGRKKEKERQRKGKNPVSPGENLYMDALENMWAKKKEAEDLKEIKKKERNDDRIAVEMKKLELKVSIEREKADLQREELELRKRMEDDKVMNMDLSVMSERQRHYYERLQDEIIARRFGAR